jgi:cell wall-associated NlpC family hydrolase
VREGLLHRYKDGAFHGARKLTRPQLALATGRLAARLGVAPVRVSGRGAISIAEFHRAVVHQLGLGDVATHVQRETRRAGLRPPPRFGTEVVARWLELRYNHPFPRAERAEPYPWQAITRAEAAYSLAKVTRLPSRELSLARATFTTYALPRYTSAQKRVLRVAVKRIGMPYIWGGETDGPSPGQARGGYDCSGLVWRAYRHTGRIRTRTSRTQALEGGRRLGRQEVRATDLVFLKWRGAIYHVGIAMSRWWTIHSADQGVHVLPLTDPWFVDEFAWAKRVLSR